ncbi:Uncharacterised protein [Mycobacteroides abscessus subsp. abscessus]|nr:Uncharacterised protein [Mycobacteroides abscessus subsp. abscessus]
MAGCACSPAAPPDNASRARRSSAPPSSLPFTVTGNCGRGTRREGIMYDGNRSARRIMVRAESNVSFSQTTNPTRLAPPARRTTVTAAVWISGCRRSADSISPTSTR